MPHQLVSTCYRGSLSTRNENISPTAALWDTEESPYKTQFFSGWKKNPEQRQDNRQTVLVVSPRFQETCGRYVRLFLLHTELAVSQRADFSSALHPKMILEAEVLL